MHAHDGTFSDEIALRLAGQLGLQRDDSARLLADYRNSPLGTRTLIVLRGSGIQWAPDDDRRVACSIAIELDSTSAPPTISGELRVATC